MLLDTYWERSGLAASLPASLNTAEFAAAIQAHRDALRALTPDPAAVQWQYRVPELGEGGSCSLFGQLAAEPYDLSRILGGRTPQSQTLLATATAVTTYYQQHSRSHWFGIYQARPNTAGEPVLGTAGQGNMGVLQSGALEESNIDLTAELVNMITTQRSYQANAQTIKTMDQALQTLVNLR